MSESMPGLQANGDYLGPCRMDCRCKCKVPEGVRLHPVPPPSNEWEDIVCCPNEGCEAAFLMVPPEGAQ